MSCFPLSVMLLGFKRHIQRRIRKNKKTKKQRKFEEMDEFFFDEVYNDEDEDDDNVSIDLNNRFSII